MLWIDSSGSRPAIECPWGQGPRGWGLLFLPLSDPNRPSTTVLPETPAQSPTRHPGSAHAEQQEQPDCDPLHGSEPLAVPCVVCRIPPGALPGCCNTETTSVFFAKLGKQCQTVPRVSVVILRATPLQRREVIDCTKPQLESPCLFNILWPNKVFLLSEGKTGRHTVIIQAWMFSSHFLQNGQNKTCCSKAKPPPVFVTNDKVWASPLSKIENFGKFVFATVSPTASQPIRD